MSAETAGLRPAQRLAYGFMGLPLAFVALPVYVQLPGLYAGFGLSLATIGAVLLAARIQDALVDPWIGAWSDGVGRRRALWLGLPLLAAGFAGLLAPPLVPGAAWMLGMLCVVHLGYSLATINHQAWAAELAQTPAGRTRLIALREGFGLCGVLLAATLPGLLANQLSSGLARLAGVFALCLLVAGLALSCLPEHRAARTHEASRHGLHAAWHSRRFRMLLAVFAPSGIAAALPATLVLFFIADVLREAALSAVFLAAYFLSAAAGLPLWVGLARRYGKARAWACAMALAILVFGWAGVLGEGDSLAFGLICVLSGVAFSAELALPASLLADLVEREGGHAGAFFGGWNLVAKLNLALAAGAALPLLGWLGYAPGATASGALTALAFVYAGLPALLKLVSLALLWRFHREIGS